MKVGNESISTTLHDIYGKRLTYNVLFTLPSFLQEGHSLVVGLARDLCVQPEQHRRPVEACVLPVIHMSAFPWWEGVKHIPQ